MHIAFPNPEGSFDPDAGRRVSDRPQQAADPGTAAREWCVDG